MPDEAVDDEQPRRRWWPQTVRVRLTIVATLAFAITITLAGFGLVRVVHNNLLGKIDETNQQQLDDLQSALQRGELEPQTDANAVCGYDFRGRVVCYPASPAPRSGVEVADAKWGTSNWSHNNRPPR